MAQAKQDLAELAMEAQQRACDDPRPVAPELHWRRDSLGWVAGKEARSLTKGRWGVRPDRVVCRQGHTGIYIHGKTERGISWLRYLNEDVIPRGETFKRLLQDLCVRVGIAYSSNGHDDSSSNGHGTARPVTDLKLTPRIWPFTVRGGRFHAYTGYWVCVLPGRSSGTPKKILQFRVFPDGSIGAGLSAGRYWRSPGVQRWHRENSKKKPPKDAEWRTLEQVERDKTYRHDRIRPAVSAGGEIYFLEGEKDVETAEGIGLVADTNPGGAGKLSGRQAKPYRGAKVVIIPDHDNAGIEGARKNGETLAVAGAGVQILEPLGGEPDSGFDFTDWVTDLRSRNPEDWKHRVRQELRQRIEQAPALEPSNQTRSIEIRDFLAAKLAPREWIIRHLIQEKDIAMIYARRGVGKTFAAQALAWAVVTGTQWLRFPVDRPTGVLYIDGEMPREDLQTRFANLAAGSEEQQLKPLRLLSEDINDQGLPSLATAEGQRIIDAEFAAFPEIGLVIIDAVSTLCHDPNANESDSKSWDSMQTWLLALRRRGIASLVLHHSGKGGDQRGTSKREDVMTQVLRLERPQDYRPEEGARFEIHFVKARGVVGDAARPVEVLLTAESDGSLKWTHQDLEGSKQERAGQMFEEGLKPSDVMEELDISRATAFRWQKQWRNESG